MRNKKIMTLATLIAVIALTICIPVFASGCGDDEVAGRGPQARQSENGDGDCQGGQGMGRGMMGDCQGEDGDKDGICDGNGAGDVDGDGICDGGADCPGATGGQCSGDCPGADADTATGDDADDASSATSDTLPSCCQ